jgi:ParB family chromosome partitioning protein
MEDGGMAKRKIGEPPRHAPSVTDPSGPASQGKSLYREIAVNDLLDPIIPARQTFDEDKLRELVESIRELGIIEPLCVVPEGTMYRVQAGHRRLIAARALGLPQVPCRIYPLGYRDGEALKHHENKVREDLNPAEEGLHFWALLESECGGDVDVLCAMVHESRQYVELRLNLVKGDNDVFQALAKGEISLGVAQELNWVHERTRRKMYLEAAVEGGASVRMVRDWRQRGNAQDALVPQPAVPDVAPVPAAAQAPAPKGPACSICEQSTDQHELEILYVHRSCARAMSRMRHTQKASGAQEGE